MRYSVWAVVVTVAAVCLSLGSCDLLDTEVKIDDGLKTTINDSTTIRTLSNVADSTMLIINAETSWHADVAKGGDWCKLSKHDGPQGRDTIVVHVDENDGTHVRQTSIVVESGTQIMIFKVSQMAAESWHDIPYWNRTAAQRIGLHAVVESMTVTDNMRSAESSIYTFDQRGNLLTHKSVDKMANRYDTTRTYTYDNANHRVTCTVTEDAGGTVVRKWRYEYGNPGKLVAFSARGWMDENPLAEDMSGMVVPDLSASYKSWIQDSVEFHEDKTFVFAESDTRLLIITDRWKVAGEKRTDLGRDTVKVNYNYFNSCKLSLPYTSRGYVKNSAYFANGMLKLFTTVDGSYDFADNSQRMLVASYAYTGPMEVPHLIDSYECTYNANHDITERKVRYNGYSEITLESYPQYEYDEQHNWVARIEEIHKPGVVEAMQNATKREFIYYRY